MAAPTVSAPKKDTAPSSALHLLVVGPGFTNSQPLPTSGSLLVGRDEGADVRIVDPLASRQHLRLHVGDVIEIEDLGSANGTRLRGAEVAPHARLALGLGEAVSIGSTILMLQPEAATPAARPPSVWPHGYFEARLIEECARAEGVRATLGLIRLHVEAGEPAAIEAAVARALRPGDVLGSYGPLEYEILLPDSSPERCADVVTALAAALARDGLPGVTGLAVFPEQERTPQALFSRACALVRGSASPAPAGEGALIVSRALREVYELAERVAASDINVLITGETGSGKELLASAVHRRSRRGAGPLVSINCSALADSLLESELFGHEKGAFTGATQVKRGLLEAAVGGSLFLDEIGEMSMPLQAKLLRVIESRTILRVGSTQPTAIDVRFIAATNRDLEEEIESGTFRRDLYFRLNGITLSVPPLRERREEIEPLARLFIENAARGLGRPAPALSAEALELLRDYQFPGNVRELRNIVERALLLCVGSVIRAEHLPAHKMRPTTAAAATPPLEGSGSVKDWDTLRTDTERQAIVNALDRCAGNQSRAAELLGMPRRTFCKRLRQYGIPRPRA